MRKSDLANDKVSMKLSRGVAIGLVMLATSCQRDGGIIGHERLPGVTGTFILEDDDRTVALTAVQHSIFYEVGGKRELVFKGAGGYKPSLSLLGPDAVLLRYCHGSINKIETSFWDKPNGGESLRILRLQVITEPGLSSRGQSIC